MSAGDRPDPSELDETQRALDERIAEADFEPDLLAAGETWAEADEDGNLVRCNDPRSPRIHRDVWPQEQQDAYAAERRAERLRRELDRQMSSGGSGGLGPGKPRRGQ